MSDLKVDGITAATANTAVTIKGAGTGKVVLGDGNLVFPDADGAAGTFITTNGSAALSFATAGKIVQVVNFSTGAMSSGTTTISTYGDTIPTKAEGDKVMELAITPTSASNKLIIEAQIGVFFNSSGAEYNTILLLQDAVTNALAVSINQMVAGYRGNQVLRHYMTAGTTSATTFKIHIGSPSASTTTFNGESGARKYGGTAASSITITEISA